MSKIAFIASAEDLWAMKRAAQERDSARAAQGLLSLRQACLRPLEVIRGARAKWPEGSLCDER
jgi:hypothetical protein